MGVEQTTRHYVQRGCHTNSIAGEGQRRMKTSGDRFHGRAVRLVRDSNVSSIFMLGCSFLAMEGGIRLYGIVSVEITLL